jgi:glyceraldehyde 3-phosphate dehydrogenase
MQDIPTFGINGFGRIGRTSFRVWWLYHRDSLDLKAINTSGSMTLKNWVHLLKYDTNYGKLDAQIEIIEEQSNKDATDENPVLGKIKIDGKEIVVTAQREPAKIPWGKYEVETVLECTGVFKTEETAGAHLKGGAKKIIISAPVKGANIQSNVVGVNEIDKNISLTSNASCTTNCVAPIAAIMHGKFGVEKAMLTTIHAYTDDQNTQDNSHQKDLRRARSAAENIIPTSTGAAKATTQIIPELEGIFDGLAVRVPVRTGSLIDMVFVTKKDVTKEEINQAFIEASQSERWKGILGITRDPIVSSDIVGTRESSIVDLELTNVVGGNLVKVISWYDNEFGYCNRLVEQILKL